MNTLPFQVLAALHKCDETMTEVPAVNVWYVVRQADRSITQDAVAKSLAALARKELITRTVKLSASSKTNFPRKVALYSVRYK